MDALVLAIKAAGGTQQALAAAINRASPNGDQLGQSAISNWFQRGKVPGERVLDVSRATQFRVTPHQLRPDLYPNDTDGLPPDLAAARGFDLAVGELSDVLRADERAALIAAFERGPQQAIREIESLELTIGQRAALLAAAQAHSEERA